MSEYDLRLKFPFNDKEFRVSEEAWTCRLAEVSDLRPGADRLSWYLVFEPVGGSKRNQLMRKLEIVTTAAHVLQAGWPSDTADRIESWLKTGEQDGRIEWIAR